jgi:hypothetical protein
MLRYARFERPAFGIVSVKDSARQQIEQGSFSRKAVLKKKSWATLPLV